MRLSILFFLAFAPFSSPLAGQYNVILNGKSYHIDSRYNWNDDNVGAGIEYDFNPGNSWKKTIMANGFRDSNDAMSYMAGAGLHRKLLGTQTFSNLAIYAGLNAFVMTRKDVNDGRPFPGLLPSLIIGNEFAALNLTYLPRKAIESTTHSQIVDPTISGIVFMQLKIQLDVLLP
ncbi:MAG TPA: hypothetical protein PKK10_07665 [Woeseiaceae bacterium]|nr:hypothetical protein [Woeseiaceae bacterium]